MVDRLRHRTEAQMPNEPVNAVRVVVREKTVQPGSGPQVDGLSFHLADRFRSSFDQLVGQVRECSSGRKLLADHRTV